MKPEREDSGVLPRTLAWVVLALMAIATLYTGWIAVANFDRIRV